MPGIRVQQRRGGRSLSYDAAESSGKRINKKADLRTEDRILPRSKRKKVVSSSRDLKRNLAVFSWAMRQHCSHVAIHNFQSKTGIDELDRTIERLMRVYSRAENCDAAKRHTLGELVYLAEMGAIGEGDDFVLPLRNGRLQLVPGDRVGTPDKDKPEDFDEERDIHGARVGVYGEAINFMVGERDKSGALVFQKRIPAEKVWQHGYFESVAQVRGISPMVSALNGFRDIMEAQVYALARAKIEQLLGLKITREGSESLDGKPPKVDGDGEPIETADTGYDFDFSSGVAVVDLEVGDDAEFMTAESPHANFRQYLSAMLMACLKALDLDFCFYDSSHTNYSGARQAMVMYQRSSELRRRKIQELLRKITEWRLEMWVASGELVLPAGVEVADLAFEWVPLGMGWIDPLKEVRADAAKVAAGFTSRQRVAKQRDGADWKDIARELDEERGILAGYGLKDDAALIGSTPDTARSDEQEDEDEPQRQDAGELVVAGGDA